MGLPPDDVKEKTLFALAEAFEVSGTPYAVIDGIAVQVWTDEPRTTKDIDVGLRSYEDVPKDLLVKLGFEHEQTFKHTDNWRGPGPGPRKKRTVVQFSVDELTARAAERADIYQIFGGSSLRIANVVDLVDLKLAAATNPERRPSKRGSDISDVVRLAEEHPEVVTEVRDFKARLKRARALAVSDDDRLGRR